MPGRPDPSPGPTPSRTAQQQAALAASGLDSGGTDFSATSFTDGDKVFMGSWRRTGTPLGGGPRDPSRNRDGDLPNSSSASATDVILTVDQAKSAYLHMDSSQRNDVMALMDAYYGPGNWTEAQARKDWDQAVEDAARDAKVYNRRTTPMQVLYDRAKRQQEMGIPLGGTSGASAYSGPVTTTTNETTTSTNLTDPTTARGILWDALESNLGRAPTDKEIQAFQTALNAAERKAPAKRKESATQTNTPTAGHEGNDQDVSRSSNVTQSGGTDPATLAREYAQTRPDYAEYQAATTYLDAFLQTLGRPV